MTIIQEKNEEKQATGSYPFSIQAIAKGSFTRFSQGNNNTKTQKPINVKIKIQNVQENLIRNGLISASHVKRNKGSSKKMHLVNSDQTIMSFDLLVEEDVQKSKKNRNKIMQLLMPGRCLKSKTDDDKNPYIPSASEVTKKESKSPLNSRDKITKSKFDEKIYTESITSNNQLVTSNVILGKCKPGGCLDPSFSEEIYSYKPALQSKVISKNKPEEIIKSVNINEISDTIDNEASDDKKSEDQNVLEKSKYPETLTNSLDTSSHSIITYPPSASSSSELKTRKKSIDKCKKNRKSFEGKQRLSQNDLTEVYFRPPKTNGKQSDGKNLSSTSEEQKKLDYKKGDIKSTIWSVGKDTEDDQNFNNNLKNQPDKIKLQENKKDIAPMATGERIKQSVLKNEDETAIFQEQSCGEISPIKIITPETMETVDTKKSHEHESEFENLLKSYFKNDDKSEYKKIEQKYSATTNDHCLSNDDKTKLDLNSKNGDILSNTNIITVTKISSFIQTGSRDQKQFDLKTLDGINTSNNLNKIEYPDPSTDSDKVKIHGYGKLDEIKEVKAELRTFQQTSNLTKSAVENLITGLSNDVNEAKDNLKSEKGEYVGRENIEMTNTASLIETKIRDHLASESDTQKVKNELNNKISADLIKDNAEVIVDENPDEFKNGIQKISQNLTDNIKNLETLLTKTISREIKTSEDFSFSRDKYGNVPSDSNADFKVENQTFHLLVNNSTLESRIIQPKDAQISNGDLFNNIKESNDYTNNAIKNVASCEGLVETPTKERKSLDSEKPKVTGDIRKSEKSLDFQKADDMENLETLPKEMILSEIKTNENFSSSCDKHDDISSDSIADFKDSIEINNISSLGVEDQISYLLNNTSTPENRIIQPIDDQISNGDLLNNIKESNLQSNDYTNNASKNFTSSKDLVETPTRDRKLLDSEKPKVTDDIVKSEKSLDFQKDDDDDDISETVNQEPNIFHDRNLTDNIENSETLPTEIILSEIKINEDFSFSRDKHDNFPSDSNADFKDTIEINDFSSLEVENQTSHLLVNNSAPENRIMQTKDVQISNGDLINNIKESNLQSSDYTNNAIKNVTSSEVLVETPTKDRKSLDSEKVKVTVDILKRKQSLDFQKNDDISETFYQKPNNFHNQNLTDDMEKETLPKEMILSEIKTTEDFSSSRDKHGIISSDFKADFKDPIKINNISSIGVEDQTSYLLNNTSTSENRIIQAKEVQISNGDLLNNMKKSNLQINDFTNNVIKNVTSSKDLVETPTKDRKSLDSVKPKVTDDKVKSEKSLDFRKDDNEVISETVNQKPQKIDLYDLINNDLKEMKHRKTSDSVTNISQIQKKESKESINSIKNAPKRKQDLSLTSKITNESKSAETRDYLKRPVNDKVNLVETKQKSQGKHIPKESNKIETQNNILLNFAFQTYLNNNNEKTIKTSNPLLKPLQHEKNSIITFTKSARINDELIIQIDSEINLHVHIRKSKIQYPLSVRTESKDDDATSITNQKWTKKDILIDTLNTLYANNLLPVQDVINKLRKDIYVIDNLQHTLKKDSNSKKPETKNLYHIYKNCSCLRN